MNELHGAAKNIFIKLDKYSKTNYSPSKYFYFIFREKKYSVFDYDNWNWTFKS